MTDNQLPDDPLMEGDPHALSTETVATNLVEDDVPPKDEASAYEARKRILLADLHRERTRRKEIQQQMTTLQAQLDAQGDLSKELEAYKRKLSRMESLMAATGSDIRGILDSRSASQRLWETDDDVRDIIKDWYQANPASVSRALNAGSSGDSGTKVTINDLLHAAGSH